MKIFPGILLFLFCACTTPQKPGDTDATESSSTASVHDTHSFARPDSAVVKHLDLELTVDFEKQQLVGKANWTIDNIGKGNEIILDANTLYIQKVTLDADEKPTSYFLDSAKPFLGQALHIKILPATTQISIYYSTSKEATALQWLSPPQTAGKRWPFLFTQSEPILARTWIPCQDAPAVRFTFTATAIVPKELMAVMSAENPQERTPDGIYFFKQTHPIPSYLMALAAGDIGFRPIDSRTGVYAEQTVVDKAAYEFADMGKMVDAAESLFGPYRWGRFDALVLPPGFPFGGMENPNLTFITPTLLAGDRSLVNVIAHELAHNWSGNLVTNATWNDVWLNEGFTTYFERRIVEKIYGKEEAEMQEVLGRQDLVKLVKEKGDSSKETKLKLDLLDMDPDAGITDIAYEKGYAFLKVVETAVGREKFDAYLRNYFNKNAFHSLTTEQFLTTLKSDLLSGDTSLVKKIRVNEWIYQPGLPSNMIPVVSNRFNSIDQMLEDWKTTGATGNFTDKVQSTNEKLYFITHLPPDINAGWTTYSPLGNYGDTSGARQTPMYWIDSRFHFTQSNNAEVQSAWYKLAVTNKYQPAYPYIEKFLSNIGRRKLVLPIYKEMVKTPEGKAWAKKIFEQAKAGYHPLAVKTVGDLLK